MAQCKSTGDITSTNDAFSDKHVYVHKVGVMKVPPKSLASSDTASKAEVSSSTAEKSTEGGMSLMELVQGIQEALHDPDYNPKDKKCIERVRNLMESYDADLNEWKRFEFWDESKNYTRNLIATDHETFTLMLLCWNPKKASPIHAHAGSNCWMRIVKGTCRELRYNYPKEEETEMELIGVSDVSAGNCAFICDEMGLHRIENDTEEPAVTLHLYAPPYESCYIFLNPEHCKKSECQVTFYSEFGAKVEYN